MNDQKETAGRVTLSRRDFVKSAALLAASVAGGIPAVHAAGDDALRVGLVGCGGRGSGAAVDLLRAVPNVRVVALGDLFPDRVASTRTRLQKMAQETPGLAASVQLTDDRCFAGFDAYQKVIGAGIDLVILATPPGFRPQHLRAAVEAGKHVFMEKPVAVCPAGVRSVIESAKLARQKGLGIVAGTQRRHQASYVETMKRIHDGAIGKVVAAHCYWCQGGLWKVDRKPEWSDLEWQIRNWLYFTWLSG
ncbi:MAG: Gfo/Idh/MocA family oxidoreductase, partial [Armatimonadota bacterium]|nr:Gfo/Idh/MocA family oxidoreductase [Armatimonadota bacterium]